MADVFVVLSMENDTCGNTSAYVSISRFTSSKVRATEG